MYIVSLDTVWCFWFVVILMGLATEALTFLTLGPYLPAGWHTGSSGTENSIRMEAT